MKIEYGSARPGDFSGKEASSEKALRDLGWKATTPFEEGVRRYIEWYREELRQHEDQSALLDDVVR